MQPKPNCLVVGAMKCATTTIHEFLRDHPDCFVPELKEPRFFCSGAYARMRHDPERLGSVGLSDPQAYLALYAGAEGYGVIADVSPQYLHFAEEAAPRIAAELGDEVAIVIVLRDPAERAFSAYNHMVRDAIVVGESFRESLDREEQRIAEGMPPVFHLKSAGLYADKVANFRNRFRNVHVLLYEDLVRDPDAFFDRLAALLGVAPHRFRERANEFRRPALPWFTWLLRRSPLSRAAKRIAAALGAERVARRARGTLLQAASTSRREAMAAEDRRYLAGYFRADVDRLAAQTGLDLRHWLQERPVP